MSSPPGAPPLEIWAGVECTLNRVGDAFLDQLERNGHLARCDDLELFAGLGVRVIRYPVLWERVAASPDSLDWRWPDERLRRLRELGLEPIVGLTHHGSGPRYTDLLDPEFPAKLARYAREVARRYPWVTRFTPVNEPLTTARFSGLYGLWYPHRRDERAFARAFLNQCLGIAAAMRAIREVTPDAELIQTEDLGKTYSTPRLRYQAEFDNERRWLTWDALSGRLNRHHRLWRYLLRAGLSEAELLALADEPCVPHVLGFNHYVTSERFLDERLERYPARAHGGNGRHEYADVEAVRVRAEGIAGAGLLAEVWARYHLPLAVTEAHLGCTREEQLRWLGEVWTTAERLGQAGADIRAVTVWSLLGTFDWSSCATRSAACYEPGVFDVRSPTPRPTALASMVRGFAASGGYAHPVLDEAGWWRRPQRLAYPPVSDGGESTLPHAAVGPVEPTRPLVILGATGTLGRAFARACEKRGLSFRLLSRQDVDITDPGSVRAMLAEIDPWAVVNTTGYVRVDDAEHDRIACHAINMAGAAHVAAACARRRVALLTFSSDLVFDGAQRVPYVESDATAPLSVYGASKAAAERRVLAILPSALVVRTSAFFGPWDEYNFVTRTLRDLAADLPVVAADDATVSPTYVPDLVHASLDLLIDGEQGIWHLANAGETTWAELACAAARIAGLDPGLVIARPLRDLGLPAVRPTYSVLGSERGWLMPTLENALARYWEARRALTDALPQGTPATPAGACADTR